MSKIIARFVCYDNIADAIQDGLKDVSYDLAWDLAGTLPIYVHANYHAADAIIRNAMASLIIHALSELVFLMGYNGIKG